MYRRKQIALLLAVAYTVIPLIENAKYCDSKKNSTACGKKKTWRSTSSSSGDVEDSEDSRNSLGLTVSSSTSWESTENKYKPKSSEERRGWRKWHRKCPPCPEDMLKKWRDKSIAWICGAYQRARRTFKSECMMHYRNCQDGTMFVKIHEYRCQNATDKKHSRHFFYDYGVDSQDTKSTGVDASSSLEDYEFDK